MSRWRVQLLGGFGLWRAETALAHRFETDSARALFAWLCLNAGKPARRDALAALLWPDTSQSAALSALRTTLTRMRRALADAAPALHSDAQTVTRHGRIPTGERRAARIVWRACSKLFTGFALLDARAAHLAASCRFGHHACFGRSGRIQILLKFRR